MNECLTTPQHEKQIGYWVSEKEYNFNAQSNCNLVYSKEYITIFSYILNFNWLPNIRAKLKLVVTILSRTEELVKAGTCAHHRRALQQLALNVHVKHSDLTWPDLTWPDLTCCLSLLSQTEELAKAGTCAHDRRALQQLALNVHVKHSDLTWPGSY